MPGGIKDAPSFCSKDTPSFCKKSTKDGTVAIATDRRGYSDIQGFRHGYSDASFLLHQILHQKLRNVENLRGKIHAFVLVIPCFLLFLKYSAYD